MGTLARKMARARQRATDAGPEAAVFSALERQWRGELRGGRIPEALRKQMRRDPTFQALVRHYERNGTVCLDDTPRYVEAAGGQRRDVLAELLGDAPEPYVCACGEEKAPAAPVCRECAESDAKFQTGGRW